MTDMNISNKVLERLSEELDELTPEAKKAARYVLENPRDVGVSTVREIANAANVKPNTVVRMARQIGFDGYDDFRAPFREAIRNGEASFPDRVRWLQDMQKNGEMGHLYAEMVSSALRNVEDTFAAISEVDLQAAATTIWDCRNVYTYGVGVNHANASNFTYLARTGMIQFYAIPRTGSSAIDDLAWADGQDVLIAITCKPYRREVIEAVQVAKEQGVTVIAVSDSPASPIVRAADHSFVVSVETPQFFPSSVSIVALLETLLSFVIATSTERVVQRVEKFHQRRHELGFYEEDLT